MQWADACAGAQGKVVGGHVQCPYHGARCQASPYDALVLGVV